MIHSKKIITFLFIFILTICEIKVEPKQVKATTLPIRTGYNFELQFDSYRTNGMTYGIFFSSIGISVVNITKDSLEIEKLKR